MKVAIFQIFLPQRECICAADCGVQQHSKKRPVFPDPLILIALIFSKINNLKTELATKVNQGRWTYDRVENSTERHVPRLASKSVPQDKPIEPDMEPVWS